MMARYLILAPLDLPAGAVLAGLTPDQVRRRRHALDQIGEGRYRATAPLQFKAGEMIDYDGEIPKSKADCVDMEPLVDQPIQQEPDQHEPQPRRYRKGR